MASLNLNTAKRPTLDLTFSNELETQLHVSFPTKDMVEELKNLDVSTVDDDDVDALVNSYELAAKLISRNRENIQVTAGELRDKYCMDMEALILFFNAYSDFVSEVVEANKKK